MAFFSTTETKSETHEREQWLKLSETVANGLRNFQALGAALKQIRDQQLYRFTYATFEECCSLHWKITARHATRLIVAYETAQELGPAGQELSERQLRPLSALPLEQRRDAFDEATADGATPAAIEKAVAKRRRKILKTTTLKPRRVKVPGGTMIFEPNKRATSYEQMANDLVAILQQRISTAA